MSEGRKRTVVGRVSSDKMEKTIVVEVSRRVTDRRYGKIIQRRSKFMAHDQENECKVGDLVEITEHQPVSRNKRWILTRVVEKAPEV